MKRLCIYPVFCVILLSLFVSQVCMGQKYAGTWKGKLDVGQPLHLQFFIQAGDHGSLSGTMLSPDQSSEKIPLSKVEAFQDSIVILVDEIGGVYRGKLIHDDSLQGTWFQSDMSLTLNLKKRPELKKATSKLSDPAGGPTERIDSTINEEMDNQGIAGLSLGIIKNGKLFLCKGYGLADVKNSVPVSCHTVFKIGSLSKQFVATCIMALSEQGKLNLSDPVSRYFPDAPETWKNITIGNLLDHTSGLEREPPTFEWMKRQQDSVLIKAAYPDKLLFKTGTKWQYSNLGYFILADIIRKTSGQTFEDYMNHFFASVGMTQSTTTTKSSGPDKAKGYNTYDKATGEYNEAKDFIALRPSGAFSCSMTDLIKWDSIQRLSNILTRQDWQKMREDTVLAGASTQGVNTYYGYGWFVRPYKKHGLVYHGGNTLGFTSDYWTWVDDGLSIIILTNGNEINTDRIVKEIRKVVK